MTPLRNAAPKELTGSRLHNKQFDNLTASPVPVLNTLTVPYDNLNFSSFVFQSAGTAGLAAGVVPESKPNYIANGPLSPNRIPTFSIQGTGAASFDLQSFYYGCLDSTESANVQLSTKCTFTVTGFKASNGKAVGPPVSFSYTPGSETEAVMMKASFGSQYVGLKEARLALTASPVTVNLTVLVVDDVKYIVHF